MVCSGVLDVDVPASLGVVRLSAVRPFDDEQRVGGVDAEFGDVLAGESIGIEMDDGESGGGVFAGDGEGG